MMMMMWMRLVVVVVELHGSDSLRNGCGNYVWMDLLLLWLWRELEIELNGVKGWWKLTS
jgi:hypothetical protein